MILYKLYTCIYYFIHHHMVAKKNKQNAHKTLYNGKAPVHISELVNTVADTVSGSPLYPTT